MQEDKLEDDDYHDWVKSTLSLLYVKEAIADTVNENAIQLHQIIRSKVETTCKSAVQEVCKDCTSDDVREGEQQKHRSSVYYINCQTNVCNHWLDAILNHHADLPKPLVEWKNINPTVWPKEPWEIAKVFMPFGCEEQRHAKDSDLNDLLTLLEKCTFFHKENFNKPLIQELKKFSNKVLHSESMKIMGQEMMEGLDRMIKFLEYQHYFNQVQSCKDAVEKIKQLRDNPIDDDLFAEYKQKAMDHRLSVLADKRNRLQMDSDASHTRSKDLQEKHLKKTKPLVQLMDYTMDDDRYAGYELRAKDRYIKWLDTQTLTRTELKRDAHEILRRLNEIYRECEEIHYLHMPGRREDLIHETYCDIELTSSRMYVDLKKCNIEDSEMYIHHQTKYRHLETLRRHDCHDFLCRLEVINRELRNQIDAFMILLFKIKPESLDHTRSGMYKRPIYDYVVRRIEQRLDEIDFGNYGPDENISYDYLFSMTNRLSYSGNRESDSYLVRPLDDLDTSPQHRKRFLVRSNSEPIVNTSEKIPGIPHYPNPPRYQQAPKISRMYTGNTKENKDWNSILCAISDSMATLADYIHNKVLPNNDEMQKTFSLFKKGFVKKDIFDALCNNICEHIGSRYESRIKQILPSYTSEKPQQLVFVVIVDSEDCEPICIEEDYLIKTRKDGMFNDEAKNIIHHRGLQQRQLTIAESKMLTCTIDKYALELMKKHQNICMVSSCIFKSKGYGSDHLIIPKLCIVIYIDIKGFIPIHDEILPASLKDPHTNIDIPTDVRESRYMNYHGGANDFHAHIKMGCMIQGSSFQGTLGGFLEKNNITYALTTAHTFLEDDVLFKTRLSEDGVYNFKDGMQEICVYQNEKKDENKIGHIVYAAINQGDSQRAGVDVAIVQLTDTKSLPVSGQFPTGSTDNRDFTEHEPMKYTSGIIQDKQLFNMQLCNTDAYKFGASTGCTKGKFITPCVYIRQLDFGLPLSRQYEVQPFGSSSFAKNGDSGALVFTKYDGNLSDLRVVGMVEGGTDHNTCIITPIWDIFEQMEIEQRFKSFSDISALELHRQTHQEVQILKERFDKSDERLGNLEHNTAQLLVSMHNLEKKLSP